MIDRAALQVAPVGDAHHHRAREGVVGAPPESGELIAELMVSGPDLVEELNLHDGLQAPSREPDGAAPDVRPRNWGDVAPSPTDLPLEPPSDLPSTAPSP